MKKFLFFLVLALFLGVFPRLTFAQAGFFGSPSGAVVSFNLNGTDVTTYGFVASNPLDIGLANTFTLKGAFIHTFKSGTGDICGGTLYYRVYKIGNTPPAFSTYALPFSSNNTFTTTATPANITGATSGDQRWGAESLNANLLTGLTGGFYRLEFYFEATGGASGGCATTFLYNNNNVGANYNIDFNVPYTSTQDGLWNSTTTWAGGQIPLASSSVNINHIVTLNNSLLATPLSLININATKSLTITSANNPIGAISNAGTLTFTSGGTATVLGSVINNGTATVGDGTVPSAFNAASITNAGTFTINPVSGAASAGAFTNSGTTTIQLGGAFAFNGNSTNSGTINVNGVLTRGNGTLTGTPPFYATNSTLIYALPTTSSITTNEWTGTGTTVGSGTPHHVQLTSASGSGTLDLPPAHRGLAGNLTLDAFTTLQQSGTLGNDLYLVGNLINNGTFTGNSRATFFQGAAAKTISGTGTSNFSFLFLNGGTLTYQKNIQLNGGLTIDASTSLISEAGNARILSLQAGNFVNNGVFTANDGLVSFSGVGNREVQGSSTTTFNQVNTSTGVDFVTATPTPANISTSLRILAGGFVVATQAPNYQANSTLIYAIGGPYGAGESWYQSTSSGPGVPQNVSIINNTSLNFSADASHRQMLGNLVIESGSTFLLSTAGGGDLHIAGDFTNNGTFNGNERAVLFNGSADQNLTGTNLINIDFLIVNKSGGKVILGREITVDKFDGVVTLTSGDIDLNGNDLLLNGTSSRIIENRTNNHIITDATATSEANKGGRVRANNRPVTTTETDIAGLGLLLNAAATGYNVNISRFHYKGAGTGIRKIYNVTGTPTSTTLSIEYANDELSTVPLGSIGMYRWAGGWSQIPASAMGNKVTATNPITSFSAWTLGDSNNPLPIRLTRFDATRISEQSVKIEWQTASEQNNLGFEIEKSEDGQNFESIAFREGAGNSSQIRDYQLAISENKAMYYRLKQIDLDGSSTHSRAVFVPKWAIELEILVYPNPTLKEIYIESNLDKEALVELQIINQQGEVMTTLRDKLEKITLKASNIIEKAPSGIYFLHFNSQNTRQIKKLIKN